MLYVQLLVPTSILPPAPQPLLNSTISPSLVFLLSNTQSPLALETWIWGPPERGLKNLNLESGFSSIIIGAKDHVIGSDQYIYELDRIGNEITVSGISLLSDNQLNLDSWSVNNFV